MMVKAETKHLIVYPETLEIVVPTPSSRGILFFH